MLIFSLYVVLLVFMLVNLVILMFIHDLVAILILPNHTSIFEQELSYEERVEMSLCNLSEIIYPFWTR